jgi:hypothetical protein
MPDSVSCLRLPIVTNKQIYPLAAGGVRAMPDRVSQVHVPDRDRLVLTISQGLSERRR